MEKLTYTTVTSPSELDILFGNASSHEGLTFDFSPEYINTLKERLDEPNAIQIIATDENDTFAGYIAGSEMLFPTYLFLSELFISPEFQSHGIATKLLEKIADAAKAVGLVGIITETEEENIPAQQLYEKAGFKKIRNPDWEGTTYQLNF